MTNLSLIDLLIERSRAALSHESSMPLTLSIAHIFFCFLFFRFLGFPFPPTALLKNSLSSSQSIDAFSVNTEKRRNFFSAKNLCKYLLFSRTERVEEEEEEN